ncbi:hypothetical protein H0R92_05160 [Treponema sp. OMZ 840]|uniref:type II toxin-antitoxin system RelB family antitoxin n=1 Tax=Treponema sp. OMZ 840 TaxID=244313 RepID=UPI003D8A2129
MLAVRLESSSGLEARLDRIASISKRSKSYLVRTLLEENIEDMELYYLGEAAYKEWVEDGQKTYSISEARKMIDADRIE